MPNLSIDYICNYIRHLRQQGQSEASVVSNLLEDSINDLSGPNLTDDEQQTLLTSLEELSAWADTATDKLRLQIGDPRDALLAKIHEHFARMPGDECADYWKGEIEKLNIPMPPQEVKPATTPDAPQVTTVVVFSTTFRPNVEALYPFVWQHFSSRPSFVDIHGDPAHGTTVIKVLFKAPTVDDPSFPDEDELAQEASMLCKTVIADPVFKCPDLSVDNLYTEGVADDD